MDGIVNCCKYQLKVERESEKKKDKYQLKVERESEKKKVTYKYRVAIHSSKSNHLLVSK